MSLRWMDPRFAALAISFLLQLAAPSPAAQFSRGDTNGDGTLDIADPIAMLSCQFSGSLDCYAIESCRDVSDANDDGKLDLSDPIATLTFLFLGGWPMPSPYPDCGEDPTEDGLGCESYDPCPPGPGGRWVGVSECGGFKEEDGSGGATASEECLLYSFADGILKLRHENAGYNCCASFSVQVAVEDGIVDIFESGPGFCFCVCLFDLDYEVTGLEPGPCLIRLSGWSGKVLELSLDLEMEPQGSYCEERTDDPGGG
jgi:hypothetical protein